MNVRPILFSPEMVRALIAGRKTQTRRVVANPEHYGCLTGDCPHDHKDQCAEVMAGFCHYGNTGDLLYVRESCRAEELPRNGADYVRYFADDALRLIDNTHEAAKRWLALRYYRGKRGANVPPIHMPRWASRLTLVITGVRVQRLNEISEDDAIAEGIPRAYPIAQVEFQHLWDDINAARGYAWTTNPWVWCLRFSVINQNVDAYIFARGAALDTESAPAT